jgi:hypothetical protein
MIVVAEESLLNAKLLGSITLKDMNGGYLLVERFEQWWQLVFLMRDPQCAAATGGALI